MSDPAARSVGQPWSTTSVLRSMLLVVCISSVVSTVGQVWQVFDMATAGLPSDQVTALAEAPGGIIWVGTSFGLCRYDGTDWQVFQSGSSGVPGNVITALAVDQSGTLWVGTQLNGIGIYDGSTWTYLDPVNSPLPDVEIKSLSIDHLDRAWIGTYLGAVCKDGPDWRLFNTSDTSHAGLVMHGNVVEDIEVRSDGLVAIGTQNGGFHYLTDTSIMFLTTYDDNFPDNSQNAVVFDELNNERWLATPSQGLLRQGGNWWDGPWFKYTTSNSTISSNAITCLAQQVPGGLWFGTLIAGLGHRAPDGTFSAYTTGDSGLPSDAVNTVLVASDGSLWVGTGYGGAARLSFPVAVRGGQGLHAMQVYPVPSNGLVRVEGLPGPSDWVLMDQAGRVAARGRFGATNGSLDLGPFETGVYSLITLFEGVHHRCRLIRQP